jgi:hypothetical protein
MISSNSLRIKDDLYRVERGENGQRKPRTKKDFGFGGKGRSRD